MTDDKIISFNKAAAEARAEAEVQSSESLERMLGDAFAVWLIHKPKSAVEMQELASIIFYGGIYFFRHWARVVEASDFSDAQNWTKQLRLMLDEW